MIGHSQGAVHTARLIDELIDPNPRLRKRFIGAIAPGANISVPIGKPVGGLFENVPACTRVGQHGCVIAFSTFNADPGPAAPFSRLDVGYWIYPEPRPDATRYEVMCTNPAKLDGGNGVLEPLVQPRLPDRRAPGGDCGALARRARLLQGRVHAAGRRPLAEPVEGQPAR